MGFHETLESGGCCVLSEVACSGVHPKAVRSKPPVAVEERLAVSLSSTQGGECSGMSRSNHEAHECPFCRLWELQDASGTLRGFHTGLQPDGSIKKLGFRGACEAIGELVGVLMGWDAYLDLLVHGVLSQGSGFGGCGETWAEWDFEFPTQAHPQDPKGRDGKARCIRM